MNAIAPTVSPGALRLQLRCQIAMSLAPEFYAQVRRGMEIAALHSHYQHSYCNVYANLHVYPTPQPLPLLQQPHPALNVSFTTAGPTTDLTADITVDESTVFQAMDGFGGSLTDSSATLFANLKSKNSANYYSLLRQLFDISDGSYSAMSNVLRIPMGASDFSATAWSYCDTAGDTAFTMFNISSTPPAVWTVLYDILAINPAIKIYLVPWSPPAWMKDSNNMRGGSLKSNYVTYYPMYFLKTLQAFQLKGIPIYAISIQNEPGYSDTSYPSMTLPAATEAVIGKALRTLMNAQGFSNVKLIGFEHNFSMSGDYPIALMTADPDSFVGAAFHCYGGTVGQIDTFRASFPAKEIHLTECSGVYGSDWWNDIKWTGMANQCCPEPRSCGNPCRGIVQINADGTWAVNQEFGPSLTLKSDCSSDSRWRLRVSAYATPGLLPVQTPTRYSLVARSWPPTTCTINFRGVQATYTFPVGLTTLSWYA
ncbi:glucan endo-1,6-beta-glucosidase [Mycena olivaceomarginata]|nr:glucan endo-1,6-beta-glucosidase [Mycena olivaceomarginata]